jgi:TRAP-type uncharacterized transport system fused permease subunit
MEGDASSIVIRLTLSLLGIFMGTLTAVGYFQATIPPIWRAVYAGVAFLLLVQPHMFEGAIWLNVIGFVLAIAAIAFEVLRGRAATKLASG